MQRLVHIAESFFGESRFTVQNLWFKRLLYVFLIYKCWHWHRHFDVLFAPDAVLFPDYTSIGRVKDLAFLLLKYPGSALSRLFLFGVLVISGFRLFFKAGSWVLAFVLDLLLWFLVLNLHNKMYAGLSGGNLLFNQFLIFNCFILKRALPVEFKGRDFFYFLQNLSILGLQLQIVLLYFVSALSKMHYSEWLEGSAISQIMNIRHFGSSNPGQAGDLAGMFFVLLSYLVLGYQLLFPFLAFWNKVRRPFLMIGVFMHLFIGLYMGLPDFAFIMLLGYLYFWPKKQSPESP